MNKELIKKYIKLEFVFLIIILLFTAYLRFYNLGYSDYHGDEHKAFIQLDPGQNLFIFFFTQRKGPMQFIVSYIPFLITHNYKNELAERIPFAIISILSGAVFYFLIKKLTQRPMAALFATALLMFNGFIVGFGRIAQYQNLNLLFSFLSIYYFSDLLFLDKPKKHAILGILFFCLSMLSHWDAVYILPLLVYYFVKYLYRKDINRSDKQLLTKQCFITGALCLLPFLIPYIISLVYSRDNQTYFARRMEAGVFDITYFKFLIDLYNPYITFWFISVLGLIGLINIKKALPFIIWFLPTLLIFEFLFRKPGTHIYNFVIPAIILCALGIDSVIRITPKILKVIPVLIFSIFLAFFYYQSYRYFLDTSKEYPFDQKSLSDTKVIVSPKEANSIRGKFYLWLEQKSPIYTIDQKLPLFGFVHKRYWNTINNLINSENAMNNENCNYITNEDKVISDWYMDAKYSDKGCFYIVGIKKPMNFVQDWYLPQYPKRILLQQYGDGDPVVKIYKVIPKV